jgi:transcriptional regulator GlxA family with amidase domain
MDKMAVGILLFDDVEVLDFAGPFEVFSRTRTVPGTESRRSEDSAPFTVFTVAKSSAPIMTTGGLQVTPHHGFADAPDIDLLLVPGGFGARTLIDDAETLDWVKHVAATAQLTTSVCTGSLVLARAGLLAGRRATTHWGAIELLESIDDGVTVDREARFVDDGVISSAGVSAGIDMAFHVVERVCGKAVADETARYIDYPRVAEA